MVLAFDLDNTLVDLNVVEDCSRELGYHYDRHDVKSWNIDAWAPPDLAELVKKRWCDPDYMYCTEPYIGAAETLTYFKDQGCTVDIVTCRPFEVKDVTEKLVSQFFPMVDDVVILGIKADKTEYMLKRGSEIIVDDSPGQCESAARCGIRPIMISNEWTPYNWYLRNRGIRTVESVEGVPAIIF